MSQKSDERLRGLGCAVICQALRDLRGPQANEKLSPDAAQQVIADARAFIFSDFPVSTEARQFWCDFAGVTPAEVQDAAVRVLTLGFRAAAVRAGYPQP